jgi:transcriptional regulator with XRE-family HTH domain
MANPKPFEAKKLRIILAEKGIMEQVIAHKLKLTKSALSRKMNGSRRWTLTEIDRICKYLGMSEIEVFPREER